MLRVSFRLMAKDPFQVLELSRAASKAEVKSKYRELAKKFHPDSPNGDTRRMEEINRAYNLLLKEGAYERFHVKGGGSVAGAGTDAMRGPQRRTTGPRPFGGAASTNEVEDDFDIEGRYTTNPSGPSGIFGDRRHPRPFSEDSSASPLDDVTFTRLVGLDAETERVTPDGKFIYQNRDTGEFVTLDKPLLKAKQTRYDTHKVDEEKNKNLEEQYRKQQVSSKALWEELSKKSSDIDQREKSKTAVDRIMSRMEDSGSLPTRNKFIFMAILAYMLYQLYDTWKTRRPRMAKDILKVDFYGNKVMERQVIEEQYMANAENFNGVTAAAALIFLAAASKKSLEDPIVAPTMDEYTYSVPRQLYRILAFS